jgi:hypothetical protein
MKNVIVFSPNLRDATSFYRAAGPFSCVKEPGFNISIPKADLEWWDFTGADVVYMHRPFLDEHVNAIEVAKNLNCKVWVDFDDNLWAIPDSNPCKDRFGGKELANAEKAARMADKVTVSTDSIQEYLTMRFDIASSVIPNAWPDQSFPFEGLSKKVSKSIFWRGGSNTHDEDLESVYPDLEKIAATYPDWRFTFAGHVPYKIKNIIPASRIEVIKPMSVINYFASLKTLAASVAIVPLVDSEFNRGKSNIAWLEATYAGMATIAPAMNEWVRPGVAIYGGSSSLFDAFSEVADIRLSLQDRSASAIKEGLLLSQINKLRIEVLHDLT